MATVSAFYQLPKSLFEAEQYQGLSNDAKLLYSLMRDRYRLSVMNNWQDALGVFIKMARKTICDLLKRSEPTVRKIIAELIQVGLIIEKRMGLTQCNRIYVQLLEGEKENDSQSCPPKNNDSAKKPTSVPERKPFAPNKNNRNQTQYKKLIQKPEFPHNGDIWEENGQQYTYHHGYIQRYYEAEELNQLFFNPIASAAKA